MSECCWCDWLGLMVGLDVGFECFEFAFVVCYLVWFRKFLYYLLVGCGCHLWNFACWLDWFGCVVLLCFGIDCVLSLFLLTVYVDFIVICLIVLSFVLLDFRWLILIKRCYYYLFVNCFYYCYFTAWVYLCVICVHCDLIKLLFT